MQVNPVATSTKQDSRTGRLALLLGAAALIGCAGVLYCHMTPRKQPSPDGKYVLTTFVERDPARALHYLCVGLRVNDSNGDVVWEHRTRTPAREKYETGWDASSRRVWLASGDSREEFILFSEAR
ncbi:hypothetical protein RAS2_26760 [Phycisphaerae bacterium RAS2]|nr:hypothetical protein RAS2_26760 [Phycisphaerae bacterium RAS2]